MLQKIKTKKFWISFVGIIIMLLQLFGVKVDAPYVNEVADSICAVLILIGLLDPGKSEAVSPNDEANENIGGNTDSLENTTEESFASVENSAEIIS